MPMLAMPTILPFIFLSGLIVGSFLNVCIYRLPRGESIVFPGSHCPHCQHPLAWYDNLPLLSFILLRGRCRYCQRPISLRYPLIELTNGILWVTAAFLSTSIAEMILQQLFASALLTLSFIDLEAMIIPDQINLFIAGLGITAFFFLSDLLWWERLCGAFVGGGILFLLGELSWRLWQKEGMGGGDIKLMTASGLLLGWKLSAVALFLSSLVALAFIGLAMLMGRKVRQSEPIPFGPALATACLIAWWQGEQLLRWYFSLF